MRRLLGLTVAAALLLLASMPVEAQNPRATEQVWRNGNLVLRDTGLSPSTSVWDDCPLWAIMQDPNTGTIWFNEFDHFVTAQDGLTSTISDTGAVTIDTAVGGILHLDTSATVADNDEVYVGSTYKTYKLAAGKDLWFEAEVKFTEANTDDANIIVGLSSVYAANTLQDNGAGPPANYDGIVFFKVDGGTVWQGETSNGSASQTTLTSLATRASGSYARLGIFVDGTTSATFFINGSAVGTITTTLPDDEVGLVFGAKAGGANEEDLLVDWFRVVQLR